MKLLSLLALLGVASAADVTKAATILGHKGENPENKIKAAKFTAGVLEPFVGSIDPMALMVCVLDIDEVLLTLDTVVHIVEEAIQTKQYPELIVAVLTLGGLVKEVKQAEIPCSQIHPEIDFSKFDRAEKILDHPIQNMKIIEDDVKLNGHSIIEDLKAAVAAYRAGDIEGFGREIGNMLKIASYDEETHKVAESAQGFLEATNVGKINIDALLYCIFDVDNTMIAAYLTGLAIYDAIKDRQPSDLIIAAAGAPLVYEGVKQAIAPCSAVDPRTTNWSDFDQVMKGVRNFKTYEKLVTDEKEDIFSAFESYMTGDYKDFGYKFGTTLMKATAKNTNMFLY
jgi:hypothetical protein